MAWEDVEARVTGLLSSEQWEGKLGGLMAAKVIEGGYSGGVECGWLILTAVTYAQSLPIQYI